MFLRRQLNLDKNLQKFLFRLEREFYIYSARKKRNSYRIHVDCLVFNGKLFPSFFHKCKMQINSNKISMLKLLHRRLNVVR